MRSQELPFFLGLACEWWVIADVLRERGVPPEDPVLRVWREAAWCHLLLASGQYSAIGDGLVRMYHNVTGTAPPERAVRPVSKDEVLFAASDLFAQLRSAVSTRCQHTFALPAA